jgi:hypothetical protein
MKGKKGQELKDLQDAKRNDLAFQLAPILMQFDGSKRGQLEDLYGIRKTATTPPLDSDAVQNFTGQLLNNALTPAGGTP